MSAAIAKNLIKNKNKGLLRGSVLLFVFAACFVFPSETRDVARFALSSAYISVSSFVAFTLALFYALEHLFKMDTDALLNKYPRWHIPISAFMGRCPDVEAPLLL